MPDDENKNAEINEANAVAAENSLHEAVMHHEAAGDSISEGAGDGLDSAHETQDEPLSQTPAAEDDFDAKVLSSELADQKSGFSVKQWIKKLQVIFNPFKTASPGMKKLLKKWLVVWVVFLVIAVVLLCVGIERHLGREHAAHIAYQNVLKINAIQSELTKLQNQTEQSASDHKAAAQALAAQLQQVQTALAELSASNPGQLQQQMTQLQTLLQSTQTNLSQKIHLLQQSLSALKAQVMPKPSLTTRALPFHVVYVDVWNGKPYAEVSQRGDAAEVGYVGLYQRMGAWKVVSISAPLQTVDFINAKGQMVHVQVKSF